MNMTLCPCFASRWDSMTVWRSCTSESVVYADQSGGANSDLPQPGRSMLKHVEISIKLVRRGANWATDPPRPWMKTRRGRGEGLEGVLLTLGWTR